MPPPRNPPSAALSAGAITSANSTGVRRGTTSSRGVRAVRAKRRLASVPSADSEASGARVLTSGGASEMDAMSIRLLVDRGVGASGGRGEAVTRESEVHVGEGRPAGADGSAHAELVDRGHRLHARALVARDRQRGADDERVVP